MIALSLSSKNMGRAPYAHSSNSNRAQAHACYCPTMERRYTVNAAVTDIQRPVAKPTVMWTRKVSSPAAIGTAAAGAPTARIVFACIGGA